MIYLQIRYTVLQIFMETGRMNEFESSLIIILAPVMTNKFDQSQAICYKRV